MVQTLIMRMLHTIPFALQILLSSSAKPAANSTNSTLQCRNQPGDPSFPTVDQLAQLNSSIDGRLMKIVPSGQFCQSLPGGCPDDQWKDARFRGQIPGAMCEVNWEQDYAANPPSLCFRNTSDCGQGMVPIYGVNATSAADIQAGVLFAQKHNLRVSVKSSGHDHLGRSTAKNSLLLWTRYFQNITYHDNFKVGGKDKGGAVTVGSGVALNTLYQDTKTHGKIFVGGHAATVAVAGGYIQGAGHSALSPKFGLAADNALEYQLVVANGSLVKVNEVSHPDLFWAIRGGGAGSWGVIISATLRTFPTFDAVSHTTFFIANNSEQVKQLVTIHAQHAFDWDEHRASQYWFVLSNSTGLLPPGVGPLGAVALTTFPNVSAAVANASMAPFLNATAAAGFVGFTMVNVTNVNDAMTITTDVEGGESIQGSRLIPADVYRHNTTAIGETYKKLLDMNANAIFAHLIAGGKVSENAHIDSAINPKWRTAKLHLQVLGGWDDSTPPDMVEAIRQNMTNNMVPILEALAGGPGSGAYSNEADVREPNFQTTFFGPNYRRLSAIKKRYDPHDLFLVQAGVGSEKWDTEGLCKIA